MSPTCMSPTALDTQRSRRMTHAMRSERRHARSWPATEMLLRQCATESNRYYLDITKKSHMFLRHRLQILLRHQKNKPLLLSQIQQTTHTKCYVSTKHILPGFFQIRQCNMKMLPRHLFLTSGRSALLFCGTVSSLVRATAVFATVISVIFSRYLSLSSSRTWSRRI